MGGIMAAGSALRSSASDEWATPQDTFDALNREFGPFNLDVCASASNAKCARFYTAAHDGLAQRWEGRVFMNPPYSDVGRWMAKARQSAIDGALVVCLVADRRGTRWWLENVPHASLVRTLPGRLRFNGSGPATFASTVVVFGRLIGRHGSVAKRCAVCRRWWYPGRTDARTCSDACRKALSRSQITARKRDVRQARRRAA